MSSDNPSKPSSQDGKVATTPENKNIVPFPGQPEQSSDQTQRMRALFEWAEGALEAAGLLRLLRDAKTREELDGIKFEPGNPTLCLLIGEALHPSLGKRAKHFLHLREKMLENILRNRFNDYKKEQYKKLVTDEQQATAEEEARQQREEDVKFYGELGQYKVRDRGVFVKTVEELEFGESVTKWVQISRTRIELLAVTRSKQDDNWGVYLEIKNMDGRTTCLPIPRSVINDMQGTIAGKLATLGADIVREERERLPNFLLTTVELVADQVQDLMRLMAVPTTGWYQLQNGSWVFVLPNDTKSGVSAVGELAIFQTEHLQLKHGFAIAGTVEEWREQILEPFRGNSNVTLAVGAALAGPLTVWAGVPPGLFHIFANSKHAKSLVSAIGQSIYGRPLIPNEANADPFGLSWLATAASLGELILTRASVGAFIEELNQGEAKVIADAAYRLANGISKSRLRGRTVEPRLSYCVPGFSTGELAMIDLLNRHGQRVTEGMRARFADIPADVQDGSVLETFTADQIPALGSKFYALLGTLFGAVGDTWFQYLVDFGPDPNVQIRATINGYQQEFRARPRVQALYTVAAPYQRSVIDRFATAAAACRMGTEAGLLWENADTDADIEACMLRWAQHEQMDVVVTAIAQFMDGRESWQGSASTLQNQLHGVAGKIDSAEALGRWLNEPENQRRLQLAGLEVLKVRNKRRDRSRLIRIQRIGRMDGGQMDGSDSGLAASPAATPETKVRARAQDRARSARRVVHKRHRKARQKVRPNRPSVRKRQSRRRK